MSSTYTSITGLWARETKRGTVISAALKPDVREKLLAALADPDALLEVVVFQQDRRENERSPTHSLVIARQDSPKKAPGEPQDERGRGSEEPAERAAKPRQRPAVDESVPF